MAKDRQAERYRRYTNVLNAVLDRSQFTLAEIRQHCPEDHAALVPRVVNLLEKEDFLQRFGTKSKPSFRWRVEREDFSGSYWLDRVLFGAQIPQTPAADRPRERLIAHGAEALRTAELVAILIRSGRSGESALQAGEKVTARFMESLDQLREAGRGELKAISPAVGDTAYCQIMAGIELGRRVAAADLDRASQKTKIRSTNDALDYCRNRFARLATDGRQEELHVVTLNTQLEVIGTHTVTVGLLDSNELHPREIFRPAIKDAAKSILLVHNHPSGDPTPSPADLDVTARLEEAAATVDIQLLDHIIVARHGCVSIQEQRLTHH